MTIVQKNIKFSAILVLPDSNRCIPSLHKSLISMLLLSIKKYQFSSQICFNEKFRRFTVPFKNVFVLQIIADTKTSLTPSSRHSIAITAISFAIFSGVEFLLFTSFNLFSMQNNSVGGFVDQGRKIQYLRCFNIDPGNDLSFANEFLN